MSDYLLILIFSIAGSAVSLAGGIILLSNKSSAQLLAKFSIPFSVGAILAVVLFDLLPESIEKLSISSLKWTILAGIFASYVLEKTLHRFHHHDSNDNEEHRHIPVVLIIVGDLLHNVLDGVAIGVSFLISIPTGAVTAIAVAAHEIPREIGDFGLLLSAGFSKRKVIITNVSIAYVSILTILTTVWLGSSSKLPTQYLLALAIGVFIYISVFELMPLVGRNFQKDPKRTSTMWLLIGMIFVALAMSIADVLLR